MKTFKSKIGLELVIPLAVIFGWMLFDSVISQKVNIIIIAIMSIIFIVYIFITTIYTIEKENLKIKCGFFIDLSIDIKTIRKVSETYNPISSPAVSIDRLEITYNNSETVLVSPKDKKGFINSLIEKNPNIEVKYRKN